MFQATLYVLVFLLSVTVFAKIRVPIVRQVILLIGSYLLYATWGVWFAGVLLVSTVMNFTLGEALRHRTSQLMLTMGIVLNLALLSVFKYLPEEAVRIPFGSLQRFSHLALPLGISFWTFQAMSYLFDLYCGEELNPSFLEFALYMAFFPVAISGPICRMPDMLPEFRSQRLTTWNEIGQGLVRIAAGVLMMQLARLLGQGILSGDGINRGFDRATRWSGTDVWCLAFGYGLQLFFDFAGYSHIAIGAARALGFTLPENFDHPFLSTTPSIFWTRWHMSLSFWVRDYIFLQLARVRREIWWPDLALVLTMVLFGLWHGATYLFLLWGLYHGVLLILQPHLQRLQGRSRWSSSTIFWTPLSWFATATLISLGWILFRANSLPRAVQMFAAIASPASYSTHLLSGSLYLLVLGAATGYAAVLVAVEWINKELDRQSEQTAGEPSHSRSGLVAIAARNRWYWIPPLYGLALLILLIVTHTQSAVASQFMYRRF